MPGLTRSTKQCMVVIVITFRRTRSANVARSWHANGGFNAKLH